MVVQDAVKVGRPKGEKKRGVNLLISDEGIKKGKKVSKLLNKSLSQYTQDLYFEMHDNFFSLNRTPEEKMKNIEDQIKLLRNEIKSEDNIKK